MNKGTYVCPECSKGYARAGSLALHRYKVHGQRGKIAVEEPKYVEYSSSKRSKKTKPKGKTEEPPKGEEPKWEKKEKRLEFRSPKSPEEVLEEILREFGCNEVFINAMVRRSKRTKGMYPGDLRNYLLQMTTGVNKNMADYIADEYGFALNVEKDKARDAGYKRPYPLGRRRGDERDEHPIGARRETYGEERHARPSRESQRERMREEGVSRGDVRGMVEDTLYKMEKKREREEALRNLGSRMTRMESDMANIPERINKGISKILEKSKEVKKHSEEITKADLEKMAMGIEKKYIEKNFEKTMEESRRYIEESRERERELQKVIENTSKERNTMLKKLASQKTTDISGYQSDSGRVIGEAIGGLRDVVETRKPVKIILEGLPKLLYPTPLAKTEKPQMEEKKIVGGGVSRYLDKEYVEE